MDIVFLRNFPIHCVIGVLEHERLITQRLILNLELETDIRPAAINDDLNKALNYAEIAKFVENFVKNSHFLLLETLAEHLSQELLSAYSLCSALTLEIIKPQAIAQTEQVGVKIRRLRN